MVRRAWSSIVETIGLTRLVILIVLVLAVIALIAATVTGTIHWVWGPPGAPVQQRPVYIDGGLT